MPGASTAGLKSVVGRVSQACFQGGTQCGDATFADALSQVALEAGMETLRVA